MKKIIQWVASSFFRQVGRFLFYIIIGGLIFVLIQHNNIEFNILKFLGFEYVKADTYVQGVDTPWYQSDLTTALSRNGTFDYLTANSSYPNGPLVTSEFYVKTPFDITNIRTGYWTVPFYIDAPAVSIANTNNGNLNLTHYLCARWIESSSGTYQCNLWSDPSTSQTFSFTDNEFIMPQTDVQAIAVYQNGYTDICTVDSQNNVIKCPVAVYTDLTGIARVQIKSRVYYSSGSYQTTYYIGLGRKVNKYSNDTQSIINNQNQNTNNTLNYFSDTNTTSDVNSVNNFFTESNITIEEPLTTIATAPFTLLNNLSTGVFNGICATLNSKQICLPSGQIIWNRSSSEQEHGGAGVHDHWFNGGTTENFISFFNLVVGGYLLYRSLLGLFKTIRKMLDPSKENLEVMTL